MFGIPVELLYSVGGAIIVVLLKNAGVKIPGLPDQPNIPVDNTSGGFDLEKTIVNILSKLIGKTHEETQKNIEYFLQKK
jgi:hypothetical protein